MRSRGVASLYQVWVTEWYNFGVGDRRYEARTAESRG